MHYLIILLLLPLMSFAQEFNFVLEPDSIPYEIDGWSPHCPWAGGEGVTCPEFCDLDGDGDYDLFIGNQEGKITAYLNSGSASNPDYSFETKNFAGVDLGGQPYAGRSCPEFCDLDNDGDQDLFSSDFRGQVHYWENVGDQFSPEYIHITDSLGYIDVAGRAKLNFLDIDLDEDYDLFIGEGYGHIVFFENTGTITDWEFELVTEEFADIDVIQNADPCFVDIDNDNDPDLFVGNYYGRIYFYRNEGDSLNYDYVLESNYYEGIDVGSYSSPEFCDLDGDGDYDLLIGKDYDMAGYNLMGDMYYYENIGTPETPDFELVTKNYITASLGYFSTAQMVDIDGDGALDLLARSYTNIIYIQNTGNNTTPAFEFIEEGFQGIGASAIKPFFVDLDNDDDYDLLCGEGVIPGPPSIALYTNRGTPLEPDLVLTNENYITNPDFFVIACPSCADIDNDGDQDLFVTSDNVYVYYYENAGSPESPSFAYQTNQWQGISFPYPNDIWRYFSFADIDGDLDLDLFIMNWVHDNIRFYRNNGTPEVPVMDLEEENLLTGFEMEFSNPFLGDIDNDGDYDLFCGDLYGGIWFFRNWGDSTSVGSRPPAVGTTFTLLPNYPNPFNAQTVIPFTLERQMPVRIAVYNQLGQEVVTLVDQKMNAGSHQLNWNTGSVSSGVYLIRIETPEYSQSQKAILVK